MKLETIACPACGAAEYQRALAVTDRFRTVPGLEFSIVRCERCQLLFTNPRPDGASLGAFYAVEGYDPFVSSGADRSLKSRLYRLVRRFTLRRKVARVSAGLARSGKALDVGCATGEFSAALRDRGFEVFGVEPDANAGAYARETHGLTVWTGGIEAVPVYAGPFDVITLWHVLEHVPDLSGTLERLRELLAPNGRLALAVPNPRSLDARLYGADWVAWDAPRHLYHFTPEVMLAVLSRAGFVPERRGAVAFDAFYHCLLSDRGTLGGLIRAGTRGVRSYLQGLTGHDGSSELYFAQRR